MRDTKKTRRKEAQEAQNGNDTKPGATGFVITPFCASCASLRLLSLRMTPWITSDVLVVGGGIVGLGTAMALAPRASVVVLETEGDLAAHQTGHNSGVIHSGLYYKPGSLEGAATAPRAASCMYAFCDDNGIPHDRCGKVVVATDEAELPRARGTRTPRHRQRRRRRRADRRRGDRARSSRTSRASPGSTCPRPASSTTSAVAEAYAAQIRGRRRQRSHDAEVPRLPPREPGGARASRRPRGAVARAAARQLRRAALRPRRAAVRRRARGADRPVPRRVLRAEAGRAGPGART